MAPYKISTLFRNGLVLAAVVAAAPPVLADSTHKITWEEDSYNPAPATGDKVLPMPCGGAMAFRKISVVSSGALDDEKIRLGHQSDQAGYAEYARDSYIAGAFRETGESSRYYLMGKYELTQQQYNAVMQDDCASSSNTNAIPATKMSWFDAVFFADKYSRWLLKNTPAALPKTGDYTSYLRLPNEEEWEFAARGGHKVSDSEFVDTTFPMEDGLERYEWFSNPKMRSTGKARAIGLLKPNPLGLHDMLGNVNEMALEPFRLRKLNRDHGQAGGYVVRGGNIYTPASTMRASLRNERAFYKNGKPWTSKTTGMRLVVTSSVIHSDKALQEIKTAWSSLGTTSDASQDNQALLRLATLKSETDDAAMKQQLETLRANLAAAQERRKEVKELGARGALELGGFLCSRLGEKAYTLKGTQDGLTSCIKDMEETDMQEIEAYCRDFLGYNSTENDEENLNSFLRYYADTMEKTRKIYDDDILAAQLPIQNTLLQETEQANLVPYVKKFHQHLSRYRAGGEMNRELLLKDCKALSE